MLSRICSMVNPVSFAILFAITGLLQGYSTTGIQKGTTCSVTSDETSGSIICHFSSNLNVSRQDFSVRRSRLDGRDTVWIIDCKWVSDRPACYNYPSYIFNGEVSDKAVIHIPELKEEHEKRYWCQVVPSEYSLVETCSFKPTDQSSRPRQATAKDDTDWEQTNTDRTSSVFQALSPALLLGSLLLSRLLL